MSRAPTSICSPRVTECSCERTFIPPCNTCYWKLCVKHTQHPARLVDLVSFLHRKRTICLCRQRRKLFRDRGRPCGSVTRPFGSPHCLTESSSSSSRFSWRSFLSSDSRLGFTGGFTFAESIGCIGVWDSSNKNLLGITAHILTITRGGSAKLNQSCSRSKYRVRSKSICIASDFIYGSFRKNSVGWMVEMTKTSPRLLKSRRLMSRDAEVFVSYCFPSQIATGSRSRSLSSVIG